MTGEALQPIYWTAGITALVATGGVAWGDLRRQVRELRGQLDERHVENSKRLDGIDQKLGNGDTGMFMRKEVADLLVERADERYRAVLERLDRLERSRPG